MNDVKGVKGVIEYPTMRHTTPIVLTDADRIKIKEIESEIKEIIERDKCPEVINAKICKNCSYYEFCYVGEE